MSSLPSGTFNQVPCPGIFVYAVEFEVEQFADPQPAGPLQQQRGYCEFVVACSQGLGEAPVGVDGQIPRQRLRQPRDVAAEHQPPRRGVIPAPFGDVGQEVSQRQHPAGAFGGGDHTVGLGVDGVDERGQIRFDVAAPVQLRQPGQAGVGGSEEPAEVREPRGQAGHGLWGAGRFLGVQVGDHRRGDRLGDPGQPDGVIDRPAGAGRFGQDVEVKQHQMGVRERRFVVLPAFPGALLAGSARGGELVEIGDGEPIEAFAGLDQKPGRCLRTGRRPHSFGEPELCCRGGEPGQIGADRGRVDLAPQARDLAFEQIVVARSQIPVEHQERDQRAGRGVRRTPHRQRLIRPRPRIGPAPQEAARGLVVGGVAAAGPRQVRPVSVIHFLRVGRGRGYAREQHRTPPSPGSGPNGCSARWCRCGCVPTNPASP